jgi:hypothetical protein
LVVERQISLGVLSKILDLRLLIARAGEQDSLAWWNSHALTDQGQWALARLYPRYAAHAGARLAIEAAAIVHTELIGHRPAITLYGLGVDLDARVARQLDLRRMDDEPLIIPTSIHSPEELEAQLRQRMEVTIDDLTTVHHAEANGYLVDLGTITENDIWSDEKLETMGRRLAAAYLLSGYGHLIVPFYRVED